MLKLFPVTDITSEFGAFVKSMLLKLIQSFPYYIALFVTKVTFMWKFTEVDAVSKNFVDIFKEISFHLAMRTAR